MGMLPLTCASGPWEPSRTVDPQALEQGPETSQAGPCCWQASWLGSSGCSSSHLEIYSFPAPGSWLGEVLNLLLF